MQAVPGHDSHDDTLPATEHRGIAAPGASRCLHGAPPLAPTAATRPERVLEAIVALGRVAGSDRGLGDYLDRVAAAICAALDYRVCVIYLYDRCDDRYYAEAMCGVDVAQRNEVLASPVPTHVVERLMDAPYRLEHGFYVPASAPLWADPVARACFAMPASPAPDGAAWRPGDVFLMPLEVDGKAPIGFLVMDEPVDGRLPRPETLRGLAALATSCANAVENAHLYQIQNNARLYRDVTLQAERNAVLYEREHEAVRRLQELDQLRSDFVSTVSHELRTPLTNIKGFTETLLSYWERLDEARRQEMVHKVNGSCRRLERLVQDLLLISRVESGVLPVRSTVTELAPLVESAVREVEGKYRGQVIQVRPPAQPLIVLAESDRVQQVVVNLLDNAAKYSPEGRPIRVRWNRVGQAVHVSVVDCGPGIDRAKFGRLFTRFGKLDRHARAGHGGTGLGLYISKSLVEAMGGGIAVRSRPGWGSIFSFTLPLAGSDH